MFSYFMTRTVNFQWDDDEVRFVLYQHDEFDFYINNASSLKQQSADIHVALLGHIILILSQPVFALSPLYCLISGEATNTNFIVFSLTRPVLETTIYRTRGEHANHYATDALRTVILSFSYFQQQHRYQQHEDIIQFNYQIHVFLVRKHVTSLVYTDIWLVQTTANIVFVHRISNILQQVYRAFLINRWSTITAVTHGWSCFDNLHSLPVRHFI